MEHRRSLPFQSLMTLRVAALVLALTAAFLWFVLGRVQRQIEQSGREGFGALAHDAFGELDSLMQLQLRYLDTLARLIPLLPDRRDEAALRSLAGSFLQQVGPNSLTVVDPNGDMLFFLKKDQDAPQGSTYTIGHLRPQANDQAAISFSFRNAEHREILKRQDVIDLRQTPGLRMMQTEWHQGALRTGGPYISEPFPIPKWNTPALSLAMPAGSSFVTLVTPLELIDRLLERLAVSPNGAILLVDDRQRLVAAHISGSRWRALDAGSARLQPLNPLAHPTLAAAAGATQTLAENQTSLLDIGGEPYLLAWHHMGHLPGARYRMLLIAPLSDLSQLAVGAREDAWLVALVGLAILLPLAWYSTGAMAAVLRALVSDSQRIGRLDFDITAAPARSGVLEIEELGAAHSAMREALATRQRALERVSGHLARLIDIGVDLVGQKGRQNLLDAVLSAAHEMADAQIAILYLREDEELRPVATLGVTQDHLFPVLDLRQPDLRREALAVHTAIHGTISIVDDLDSDPREELTHFRRHNRSDPDFRARTIVSLPLRTHDQRIVGVMQVVNARDPDSGKVAPFSASQVTYLEALAAEATVALENQTLIASQSHLLETLVRTLGDAIDAKSAYTGRHCARVPELAMMLAEEAHAAASGPLAAFAFRNDDEWREFRTGAWLHDCGKITSPEHVMDKATKLETVHNRLHEIRTRFEVLLRDARIDALQARLDGNADAAAAEALYEQRARSLQDDYAFIAGCNAGSEKMAAADIARIHTIGARTWLRHFDVRLGLSYEEQARMPPSTETLPAIEALLADQAWHRIERPADQQQMLTDGFRMDVPALLYNHGELYNLCVDRGTLNGEERFKINEHIIHTIRMLEGAQFPAHLRRVPEYAGTHHETLDGGGYPRGLTAAELSIPARIMAIADIFEALTASDRPYKPAKPLSESLAILQRMKLKGKIDADLFELFLRKGVYLRYAQRFLAPEQLDVEDIEAFLA